LRKIESCLVVFENKRWCDVNSGVPMEVESIRITNIRDALI